MKKFFSVFMIAVCCMALAMPAQAQFLSSTYKCNFLGADNKQ